MIVAMVVALFVVEGALFWLSYRRKVVTGLFLLATLLMGFGAAGEAPGHQTVTFLIVAGQNLVALGVWYCISARPWRKTHSTESSPS